jgi:hypothetical protein
LVIITKIHTLTWATIPFLLHQQALLWAQQCSYVRWRFSTILLAIFGGRFCLVIPLAVCVLLIAACTKHLLLGRRKPGHYAWDTSSYCQRWQVSYYLFLLCCVTACLIVVSLPALFFFFFFFFSRGTSPYYQKWLVI